MKKLKLALLSVLCSAFAVTTASASHLPQNGWANEDFITEIGNVYTPLFGTEINKEVGSSWNEPRGSAYSINDHGPHTGVDQSASYGAFVGPMQTPARILRNESISNGGNTQTIRYYNATYNRTYYSMYMHLDRFIMGENTTPALTDYTAAVGNTGPSGTPTHLHFELLSSLSADVGWVTYSSRVGANPMNHVTNGGVYDSTRAKFAVFKNFSADRYGNVYIDAWDSNSGTDPLTDVKLYYRPQGQTSWTTIQCSLVSGSAYRYTAHLGSGTFEYFFAGRRNTGERWVLYPVSVYDTTQNSGGPDLNAGTYRYKTVIL